MSIYSDNAGNWYLGDCRWGNHDILYPNTYYLDTGVGTDKTTTLDLFNQIDSYLSNFSSNREILPSNYGISSYCSSTNWYPIFRWNPVNDNRAQNNWAIEILHNGTNSDCGIGRHMVARYRNNSGVFFDSQGSGTTPGVLMLQNCCMCADPLGESFTLFAFILNADKTVFLSMFLHVGVLSTPNNGGEGYYTRDKINHTVLAYGVSNSTSVFNHYTTSSKSVLTTGRAEYPIACQNNVIPNVQWATDFLIFDDNPYLGFPAIGRIKNMLLSTARGLTIGKPVYVDGTAIRDGGSRWFIPVGSFAGKTILMRCYSSTELV